MITRKYCLQHGPRPVVLACVITTALLLLPGCTDESTSSDIADILQKDTSPAATGEAVDTATTAIADDLVRPVPATEPPWPRATYEETEYNFGRARMGEKDGEHEFTITNTGDAPLELVAGRPTCQCTEFKLSREVVPPGESATLHFTWKLARLDPKFSHGGDVYTNDPEQKQIMFRVVGIVDEAIAMKPSGTWHAGNLNDEPVTFETQVFSRVMDELTIVSATTKTDFTTIDWTPLSPIDLKLMDALSGYRFQVTVSPEFPVGRLDDLLTLQLQELEKPLEIRIQAGREGSIHMVGMKGARFNADKKGLNMGRFKAAEGREAQLMLIVKQDGFDEELKILNVDSDIPALDVSLENQGESSGLVRRYVLTIAMPPGSPHVSRIGGNPGKILCETNHPSGESIDIRVLLDSY